MSLNIWTKPSGFSLGSFPELEHIDQMLPVENDTGVSYSVISGSLPGGMFIKDNHLFGSPYSENNITEYTFCIRASLGLAFSDRTFTLSLTDIAQPEFITPAGELDIGLHHQFYILDGSYVNYQVEAVDLNPSPTETLTFTIEDDDGVLPPGLELSQSGVISGFVGPSLTVQGTEYQYALPYPFTVTITDGINFNRRSFSIFVADPDAFRADSLMRDGLAGRFTSDSTYLQQPVWLTDSDLGIHRANNYMTMPIGLYDKRSTEFRVEATNMEVYANTFQVTNSDNNANRSNLTVTNVSDTILPGYYFTFENYVSGASDTLYKINTVTDLGDGVFRLGITPSLAVSVNNGVPFYIGTPSELPPGLSFDTDTSELYGRIPYQPSITETYTFTITATRTYLTSSEQVQSSRTFDITLLGDITSVITWNTDSDLGTLDANYISSLSVNASTNIENATLIYKLDAGTLPPGLTLATDGELIGMVNQFYNPTSGANGLITFDYSDAETTFDNGTTTFDRSYNFTVKVNDQYLYSTARKDFTVKIATPNTTEYSNIFAKPFLSTTQRSAWNSFITDASIFVPSKIYRPNDTNFGVQKSLVTLIYAGVETNESANIAASIENGFKKKRFTFGSIGSALASNIGTGNSIYEVVYVELNDPLEYNGKHLQLETTDGYYPNSISNWRTRLSENMQTERNYLPLWMRSIQPGTKEEPNFKLVVPLCYCKVGSAADIIINIKANGFDFSMLDYTIDRIVVDAVRDPESGDVILGDKYFVFNNNRTTI